MCLTTMNTMRVNLSIFLPPQASVSLDQTVSPDASASWSGQQSSAKRAIQGPQHSGSNSKEELPYSDQQSPERQSVQRGPPSVSYQRNQTIQSNRYSDSDQTTQLTGTSLNSDSYSKDKAIQSIPHSNSSLGRQVVKQNPNSNIFTRSNTIVIEKSSTLFRRIGKAREKVENASDRKRSGRRRRCRRRHDGAGNKQKQRPSGVTRHRHNGAFAEPRVTGDGLLNQTLHQRYLDVTRMDGGVSTGYSDRLYQIQQLQLRQQERRVPSPYPVYDFKKPEDFHPKYQTKDPASFQSEQEARGQGHAHPGYDSRNPQLGFTMSEYSKANNDEIFLTQSRTEPYGGRGDGFESESRDPYEKLRARDPYDYRDDRRSDPLHSRHGSMTDDDKMNESERDRDRRSVTSDEEAERGLEMLRQLHEQAEAARRLDESDDVREDPDDKRERQENGRDPRQGAEDYDSSDSGSATPTNGYPNERTDEEETHRSGSGAEDGRYNGGEFFDQRPGQNSEAEQVPPRRPPEQAFNGEVYYSLSKKHYHPALPNSEPSYSRDPSPGPGDRHRAQSQQQLRLVYDSNDLSQDSGRNSLEYDPGITFDRYARRASRASVLSKAEQLLNNRKQSQLRSITEWSGETPAGQGELAKKPPHRKMPGTRRVAFVEEEEEEEDDGESDRSGGGFRKSRSSFRSKGSSVVANSNAVRRKRLHQLNVRIKSESFRNLQHVNARIKPDNGHTRRNVPNRKGSQRRRVSRVFGIIFIIIVVVITINHYHYHHHHHCLLNHHHCCYYSLLTFHYRRQCLCSHYHRLRV